MRFESWRFIDTGSGYGSENMAIDEALLNNCQRGCSPPILHFYTWAVPVITIGYFQELSETVRIKKCRALNIEVIRRITGGRAVVHHNDLSFSLIFPLDGKIIPPGILSGYLKIAGGFIRGLKGIGINADFVESGSSQSPLIKQDRQAKRISACFLTRIRYEVVFKGRKMIGFAQKRIGKWVLQQGTLMIDLDRSLWYDLLNYPKGSNAIQIKERLLSDTISINEALGRTVNIEMVKRALFDGLSAALGVKFESDGLYPIEESDKRHLVCKKYNNLLAGEYLC